MQINSADIAQRKQWEEKGYRLPAYDREAAAQAAREKPFWVHFGAGNIFRAFHAKAVQRMLDSGELDRGIIAVEGYDREIIERINRPCDDYSLLVTLKADGTVEKDIIGSVAESLVLDPKNEKEFDRLKEIFRSPSLQIVSFTITEKGYGIYSGGKIPDDISRDFDNGSRKPESYMGKVTALLYERFLAGALPTAMVSMDNCSGNGDKLHQAVIAFAEAWCRNGYTEKDFLSYVNDKSKVSFPCTMIDKITPRPDSSVEEMLKNDGIEGAEAIVTEKNTYIAPYVNAEQCEYLVIEDEFPNGRPCLERCGFIFTDRETVGKAERMKVCTCLNPVHTALAVYGCLLGYDRISEEMKDSELRKLAEHIAYTEGLPVVTDPKILDPEEFADTVINERISNPFIPDTPQRIASDTSQKLAVRFGETIKAYGEKACELKYIPLVIAGWLRYLMAVDDRGRSFELSPDPFLGKACASVSGVILGKEPDTAEIRELLHNSSVFGVDLHEAGLADKICGYFSELTYDVGAVRDVLRKYCS